MSIMLQETTTTRSNALVDPGLNVWHYEVPLYLFLGGLVAGLMVLGGWMLLRRPPAARSRALSLLPWAAPALLTLGMLFLWLDLENRLNAHRFYFSFQPASPMSWGAWILLAIYPLSLLLAWAALPEEARQRGVEWLQRVPRLAGFAERAAGRERSLAGASMAAGAALGVYTGVLLGTLAARPLWNSAVLGPLFLVSGISTGAAFMLLARLRDDERVLLGRADVLLIVAELALIGLWFAGLASGGAASRSAVALFFGGPYTAAFWLMVVTVGLLTPLAAELLELRHRAVPGRAAALFVLCGGLALRWIIVDAGQHSSWISAALLP